IPWLGDIPEHWELKKIKHILRKSKSAIKTGPFGSQLKESDLTESGIKIYTQRNILDNNFEKGSDYISQEKFEELNAFEIFPNDILITTRGTIGRCAIFPEKAEKGVMHPCLIRIQIDQELIVNEYLYWYIQESNLFKQNILYNSNPTTIEVIYSDTLKEVKIPVPPLSEQLKIVKNLIVKSKYFDKFISNIHNQINQLKEYRKTLISDVVTGKIDVRGFEP
ncbi:MAG TPA: restriction endonuclease subunit S, partial [Candidatus Kapabacteria bacterium]|nr:restriction endonuclease subunit S [Candidatus Kapabacteria bacterium]